MVWTLGQKCHLFGRCVCMFFSDQANCCASNVKVDNYLSNKQINSMAQSSFWKANISSAAWKILCTFGTRTFFTLLPKRPLVSLSLARWIESMTSHLVALRSIFILSPSMAKTFLQTSIPLRSSHPETRCAFLFTLSYMPHFVPITPSLILSPE